MNKGELIEAVAARAGSDRAAARRHVDALFEAIMENVSAGEKVIVTGFGTFDRVGRQARTARNPRTGGPVDVPAADVPRFRIGRTFKDRVAHPASDSARPPARPAKPAARSANAASPANGASKAEPTKTATVADKSAKPKKNKKSAAKKATGKKAAGKAGKKVSAKTSPGSGKKTGKKKAKAR